MKLWIKTIAIVAVTAIITGCAEGPVSKTDAGVKNERLTNFDHTMIEVPTDPQVIASKDEALPFIQAAIYVHQCINNADDVRYLNRHSVPGVSFDDPSWVNFNYPNSATYMRYHDRRKCVSVSAINQWTKPALNVLQFRAVYFAEDSGETVKFGYVFKKFDDGSWRINSIERNPN